MNLNEALAITSKLGTATKMPCYTYSISNKSCNRGSKLRKIPGSICSKCYASRGNFQRPKIQRCLNLREQAMKHPLWKEAMVQVLTNLEHSGHFRWFSSGDIQGFKNLLDICFIAKNTPHIKHWLPTHEIGLLASFKRAGFTYPSNLVVRLCSDRIEQKPSLHVLKNLGVLGCAVSKTKYNCVAPKQENKCQTCRKCWSKRSKIVTYKYH